MKKTPKDLATSPAFAALNATVAVTALAGIASKSIPSANATEASYDLKLQKSTSSISTPEMTTYNTVATDCGFGRPDRDDSKTTTDTW